MPLVELSTPFRGALGKKKPDGVAQRSSRNECFLLEFTRTTDFSTTSLDLARLGFEEHGKKTRRATLPCLRG
eukprot:1216958-Rhodomonas_salina.1